MADYLHGVYGKVQAAGSRVSTKSQNAIVYIGTAPVHTVEGGAGNVNKPILVFNIAEARKKLGYSEDFASYTLCEAMHAHLDLVGVGPLVFINVLDPNKHASSEPVNKSLTPENGRVTLAAADNVVLDTVAVKSGEETKVKGQDYHIGYNIEKQTITITEAKPGALGTAALNITYKEVDPSMVTVDDVIGETDGNGLNTGVYAIQNVIQETGYIPTYLLAPGFIGVPAVHNAIAQVSRNVNGHWHSYMLSDIPIVHEDTQITLASAAAWKKANGYNKENETVNFPMVDGMDDHKYHLSTLRAANFQALLAGQGGIPWQTASNTECSIIRNLYLGEEYKGRVYDDTLINERLCKNGIASAAFVGGKFVLWGAHSADYDQENANEINVAETNRMMLYYVLNDFQYRHAGDVDTPMTLNRVQSIAAEEQARLEALRSVGALVYGKVRPVADADARSDMLRGDFSFAFEVSTTPLVKSMTGIAIWTSEGYKTYFASFEDQ